MFICSGACFLIGSLLVEKKGDSLKRESEKLAEEIPGVESNEN